MQEHDSFRLFESHYVGPWIIAGFLILLFLLVGTWDHADAIQAEAEAKVARAERAAEPMVFQHPIPYDAVIVQSGPGIEKAKPRLYVRASNRGEAK